MERNPDESFDEYKARRAVSNEQVRLINYRARSGGGRNSRADRPSRGGNGIKGIANTNMTAFGAACAAQRASKRVTGSLLMKHSEYTGNQKRRRQMRDELNEAVKAANKISKPRTAAQLNYRAA